MELAFGFNVYTSYKVHAQHIRRIQNPPTLYIRFIFTGNLLDSVCIRLESIKMIKLQIIHNNIWTVVCFDVWL